MQLAPESLRDRKKPEEIAAIVEHTMLYAGVDTGVRAMTMLIDCVAEYEEFCRNRDESRS